MRTTFLHVKFAKRYALLRIPSARKSATVGLQTAIWIDGVSVQPQLAADLRSGHTVAGGRRSRLLRPLSHPPQRMGVKIGRASCRERGEIRGGGWTVKKI